MTKKHAGYWAGLKKLIEAADDSVEIFKRSVAEAAQQSRGPLSTNNTYAELCAAIDHAEADRLDRVRRTRDPKDSERMLVRQLQRVVSLCAHYELENRKLAGLVARADLRAKRDRRNLNEREEGEE